MATYGRRFDPDSTSDVLLEDSFFSTGDDGVAVRRRNIHRVGPDSGPASGL